MMFSQLIVFCFAFVLAVTKAVESNSGVFTVKEKHRNNMGVFYKSKEHKTLLSCGHACFRNKRCIGTNFRSDRDGGSDCEFVDISPSDLPRGLEFDRDWTFSLNMKGDCRFVECSNGGTCVYHSKTNQYTCDCTQLWTGTNCQQIKVSKAVFHFTVLGSRGRLGPTNNSHYHGTVLQNTVIANGIQTWTVPLAENYHVTACGGAGGNGTNGSRGGKGALVNGTVQLNKDDSLQIIIGQMGMTRDHNYIGSGGGGTFIVLNNKPLVIAGGGGGGGTDINGGDGRVNCGNRVGLGGEVCATNVATTSGGGGGFQTDGLCFQSSPCVNTHCVNAGKSFLNGGVGGAADLAFQSCDGGYGGGGACSNTPGGGGGYSGGSVTFTTYLNHSTYMFAEGGCSLAPPGGLVTTGGNDGDGYAIIKLLP